MAIEIVDFPINSMVIFHSYVKLPEGTVLWMAGKRSGSRTFFILKQPQTDGKKTIGILHVTFRAS